MPNLHLKAFAAQMKSSTGFWMSFHELTAGYPWLTKRIARVLDRQAPVSGRNPFAYLMGAVIPYAGRLGGGFGLIVLIYIFVVLASVALPAYQDYTHRVQAVAAIAQTAYVRDRIAAYYETKGAIPHLSDIGVADTNSAPGVAKLALDANNMVLTVSSQAGAIVFIPSLSDTKHVLWKCRPGEGTRPQVLPMECQN